MVLAVAKPSIVYTPAVAEPNIIYSQPAVVATAPLRHQYHSQDSIGQYVYGYSGGPSAKTEARSLDGVTRGSYSYVDAEGKIQTVDYSADAFNGFRVAATNLPVGPVDIGVAPEPVKDTPEVVKARADHLAILEQGGVKAIDNVVLESVKETPEVEKARLEHLAIVEQGGVKPVELRSDLEPVKETAEVAKAREEHLMAIEKAKTNIGPIVPDLVRVDDTIEVKVARDEHLKAIEIAKARNAIIAPEVRFVPNASPLVVNPIVSNIETRIGGPVLREFQAPISQIRLEQPLVQRIETIIPSKRFDAPEGIISKPIWSDVDGSIIGYQTPITTFRTGLPVGLNVVASDFATNAIVNRGLFNVDTGRLIRSTQE